MQLSVSTQNTTINYGSYPKQNCRTQPQFHGLLNQAVKVSEKNKQNGTIFPASTAIMAGILAAINYIKDLFKPKKEVNIYSAKAKNIVYNIIRP